LLNVSGKHGGSGSSDTERDGQETMNWLQHNADSFWVNGPIVRTCFSMRRSEDGAGCLKLQVGATVGVPGGEKVTGKWWLSLSKNSRIAVVTFRKLETLTMQCVTLAPAEPLRHSFGASGFLRAL
jgi:hypothetical protein